jgi:hypothetical protein
MDDEYDYDRDAIVDLDGGAGVTGNPALDVDGYQSPGRRGQNLTGFSPHPDNRVTEALAQSKRDREARAQRRRAAVEADRTQRGARGRVGGPARPAVGKRNLADGKHSAEAAQDRADEIARRSLTELQPGQHGAFFEKRLVRRWYWPWRKVTRWQQISAWMHTTPPTSGTEVVTVGSVDELPGQVHTIGTVDPQTGAVEY